MTLPRPVLSVHTDERPVRRARISMVRTIASAHATATGGRLFMPVLAVLDRLLPRGPLPEIGATLAPGVRVRLDSAGAIARGALIGAGYEHREVELLAAALRPGGVFIDVGANIGWFSLLIAAHRPDATVWAMEPLPATADVLEEHVRKAGLGTVRVLRFAAAATTGTALFERTTDNAFAHLADDQTEQAEHVLCMTTPLDDLWHQAGCPRVDAVKVDVEGGEPGVLVGARELLRRDRPVLIAEAPTEDAAAAVTAELAPHGYHRRHCPGTLPYNAYFVADS